MSIVIELDGRDGDVTEYQPQTKSCLLRKEGKCLSSHRSQRIEMEIHEFILKKIEFVRKR